MLKVRNVQKEKKGLRTRETCRLKKELRQMQNCEQDLELKNSYLKMVKSCRVGSMVVPIFRHSCHTPIQYMNVPPTSLWYTIVLALPPHCPNRGIPHYFVLVVVMSSIINFQHAIICLDINKGLLINNVVSCFIIPSKYH